MTNRMHFLDKDTNKYDNLKSHNKIAPLISAIERNDFAAVQKLLKTTDVNSANDDGMTPLMFGVIAGNEQIINLLLKHGANPAIKDVRGVNSIMLACKDSLPAVILQKLLNLDSVSSQVINATDILGTTALMWAAGFGDIKKIKILLKAGADGNLEDNEHHTAADWAAHNAQAHKLLVENNNNLMKRKF